MDKPLTAGVEDKTTKPVVMYPHHRRSNSVGSAASANSLAALDPTRSSHSTGTWLQALLKGYSQTTRPRSRSGQKTPAGVAPTGDQLRGMEKTANSFDCDSLLQELHTTSSNDLTYNKGLFEQRFNLAKGTNERGL